MELNSEQTSCKKWEVCTLLILLRRAKDLGELDFADLDRLDSGFQILKSASVWSVVGLVRIEDQGALVGRQLAVVQGASGPGARIWKCFSSLQI